MLDLPTLREVLLAEQQQIQVLLQIAAYAKVVNELADADRQKNRNIQSVNQNQELEHNLKTDVRNDSQAKDESEVMDVAFPRAQIDLWKPIGLIGDSNLENPEHQLDGNIAISLDSDSQHQSWSPDTTPATNLTSPSSLSPNRIQTKIDAPLEPKCITQNDMNTPSALRRSNPENDFQAAHYGVDEPVVPQFNEHEDDVYMQDSHIDQDSTLNGTSITNSDKDGPQIKFKQFGQNTVIYRGVSPGGSAVDIIEILDSPSPPESTPYKDHDKSSIYPENPLASSHSTPTSTNGNDNSIAVNEDLDMQSYSSSQLASQKNADIEGRERALATHYKPLRAKRLRYSRGGLSRLYAKSMHVKQSARGWIKRRR